MKKLIFLMLVLLASFTGYSQTPWRFINNKQCDIRVRVFCFDNCSPLTGYGPALVPKGSSTVTLTKCPSSSVSATVFEVCWAAPGCSGSTCIYVPGPGTGATCGLAPVGTILPNCPGCGSATVVVNPGASTVTFN
jgi:hypothetical protein